MTAPCKHKWHLQLLTSAWLQFSFTRSSPLNKFREGSRGWKVKVFVLQLQGALTSPAVTRAQTLSLTCTSFPSTPCSWLLGVVNQHPPKLPEHGGSLACCPNLPPVRLMRPELRVRPWRMEAEARGVKGRIKTRRYDSIPEQWEKEECCVSGDQNKQVLV